MHGAHSVRGGEERREKDNRVVKKEWKGGHRGEERKQEINNKVEPESDVKGHY